MAITSAVVGGVLALGGIGLNIGGIIAQGEKDKEDAAAAKELAKNQYDLSISTLETNYNRELAQSKANAGQAIKNQNENYAALLGNARQNAAIKTKGVDMQEGYQAQSASSAGTSVIGQTDASRGASGASGKSAELVRKNQRGQLESQQESIGEQADFARGGIATNLAQTEATARRNLNQNINSIKTQQAQFEQDAVDSYWQNLDQAELNKFSTEYGIPNAGDINTATTLDALSSGLNFGSELLDLYDDISSI